MNKPQSPHQMQHIGCNVCADMLTKHRKREGRHDHAGICQDCGWPTKTSGTTHCSSCNRPDPTRLK